jgi:hypothetical protein
LSPTAGVGDSGAESEAPFGEGLGGVTLSRVGLLNLFSGPVCGMFSLLFELFSVLGLNNLLYGGGWPFCERETVLGSVPP